MPVTLMCPTCHGAVAVPDELLGGNVTCPYCRNVFLAPAPLPPPVAPPAPPPAASAFSFDAGAEEKDDDERPRPRDRRAAASGSQQVELTAGSWIVLGVVVAIVMGLGIGMQSFPKWIVNGIDMTRVLSMGGIGAVVAVGMAVARALGKPKGGGNYRNRR
jgi:hypothetical protein